MTSPAIDYAHQNHQRFLSELLDFLRIPSISTLPEHSSDMSRSARWLADRLQTAGLSAETIPSDGPPLVYGEWLGAPGAPTVLIYGHYDVQPVDPLELWHSPPFEPEVRDGNVYARGASDDKGQTMTFVYAIESLLRATGKLPVNLKLLVEGQEECGGAVIKDYVAANPRRLDADFVQVADSGMFAPGIPTVETGLRGVVYTEVIVKGPAHDLHSGLYGGVAPNPLNAMSRLIADLQDASGRITIAGFYDDVRMPDDSVRRSWHDLPFDEQSFLRDEVGAPALVGEPGFTPLERIWARPTLDVHGIAGGFTGVGAKTVIPAQAIAKISMRLVPDQRAEVIFQAFREHVLSHIPPGTTVDIRLIHGDDPVLVPEDSEYLDAALSALKETFGRPAVLGRSGGSIPIVGVFKENLGLSSLLMGWGLPDDNLHAPNEKLSLANFRLGIEATIRFWTRLGAGVGDHT